MKKATVADIKSCGVVEPHDYHGWTEPGTGFDGKFWHVCGGVEETDDCYE